MFSVTLEQARQNRFERKTVDGKTIWRSRFFGPPPSPETSSAVRPDGGPTEYVDPVAGEVREPQAFLIEQDPQAEVGSHFHFVDQFQVVVAGGGLLGRHPVAPLSVHFSARCTGYGPISPGDEGLSYFTFRASADETGAQYLPEAKSRMRAGKRRNVILEHIALSPESELSQRSEVASDVQLDDPDGLAVTVYRLPAMASVTGLDPALGQGVTALVTTGSLECQGTTYPKWSCFYTSPDEGPMELKAGAEGAEVLMLRYPRNSPAAEKRV